MAKPLNVALFTAELEYLLLRTWETRGDTLNEEFIRKTREAISHIREFYTFKRRFPSKINYRAKKHRAGYLAAFGQRHAFLPYYQLKHIKKHFPSAIPKPIKRELTITLLGAGAAIELFGILFYYNEIAQNVRKINLINIEKITEWDEVRSLFIKTFLKNFFRKVSIIEYKISADLRKPIYKEFADIHDVIVNSDILMCYNMLNENEVHEQYDIIENLRYILLLNKKKLLTLLMEPAPNKAIARVRPFKEYLASISEIVHDDIRTYKFDREPLVINYEPEQDGLNRKLYGQHIIDKYKPILYKTIKRICLATLKEPHKVVRREFASKQIKELRDREKGYFIKSKTEKDQTYLPLEYEEVEKY